MTRLEQLRIDARLSPEGLGSLADVAGGTIRRIEDGKGAQIATLGKLADALTAELRKADDEAPAVKPSELLRDAFESSASELKGAA